MPSCSTAALKRLSLTTQGRRFEPVTAHETKSQVKARCSLVVGMRTHVHRCAKSNKNPTCEVSFVRLALVRTGNSTKSNRDELVRYLDWMGRPRPKDWELDDPTGKPIDQIRPFLEEIDRRV